MLPALGAVVVVGMIGMGVIVGVRHAAASR
jgi:hypothetical protein